MTFRFHWSKGGFGLFAAAWINLQSCGSKWRNPGGYCYSQLDRMAGFAPRSRSLCLAMTSSRQYFHFHPLHPFQAGGVSAAVPKLGFAVFWFWFLSDVAVLFSVFTVKQKHLWPEGFKCSCAAFQRLWKNFGRGCSSGMKMKRAKIEDFL